MDNCRKKYLLVCYYKVYNLDLPAKMRKQQQCVCEINHKFTVSTSTSEKSNDNLSTQYARLQSKV